MFNACCQDTVVKNQDYYLYKGTTNNSHERVQVRESRLNTVLQGSTQQLRLYAKSKTQQSVIDNSQNNQLYTDKSFPPNSRSLGIYQERQVQWIRLSELYQQTEESCYSTMDILSMKDRDSYFLASIAALIEHEPFVREVFDEEIKITKTGAYKLRLNNKGMPKETIIDDYLPVYKSNHKRAVFCHIDPSLIWVPLLEKAYAKIHRGYDKIQYGFAHEVLSTFSLAPCIYQTILTDFRQEEQEKCWNTLLEAYESRFPCVVGSRKEYTCQDILQNSSYCLKQCRVINHNKVPHRFVVLWNLPPKVDRIAGKTFQEEAEGFAIAIPLVEFMRNFEIIDTVHTRQNYSSYFYQCKSQQNSPALFTFEINQKTNLYITLHRQNGDRARLRLIVVKFSNENTLQFVTGKKQDIYEDVTLRLDKLPVGKYLVMCESMSASDCLLKVYTPSIVTFTKYTGNYLILLEGALYSMGMMSRSEHQRLSRNHQDWYYVKSMFQQIGLGVFMVKVAEDSQIRCQLSLNKHQLYGQGLLLINKLGGENYYNIVERGSYDVLVFDISSGKFDTFAFPPSCMKLKMIV